MPRHQQPGISGEKSAAESAAGRSDRPAPWRFWASNSIAKWVWLSFGGLISIMLIATLVLQGFIERVDRGVTQITEVEEAITAAAYEMEINVIGTGMSTLQYLDTPEVEYRIQVATNQADFEKFQAEFDRLASTPEERELAAEVAELYTEFKTLGVSLMAQKDRQEELFRIVGISFAEVDLVIDDELQPIIDSQTVVGLAKSAHAVEMELSAAEVGAWLGNYLRVGSEEYRMRISDDTSDFWEALFMFRDQGATVAEETVLVDLEYVFGIAIGLTDEILAVYESIEVGEARFTDLRRELGGLLDGEIQLLTEEALVVSRADAHASVEWMTWVIRVMLVLGIGIGAFSAAVLARRIVGPVRHLAEGAEAIGRGDLTYRIEVQTDDELGAMARAFNLMAERRQRASDSLELIVAERTSELRASEAGERALLAAIPDSIMRIDASGVILEARMSPEAVFPELNGREFLDELPPDASVEIERRITKALANGSVEVFEYEYVSNGSRRDSEVRMVPIEGTDELVLIDRDITIRKAAERDLKDLIHTKNEFLASVSHELRTPLTAVLGFAELLVESASDLGEDERQEMVESIAQQASDLASIVEDLLVAARSELGEVEVVRKPVQLLSQLAQVVEMLKPAPSLEISDGESVTALGDPARVRQIIRNVITNGVRYGGEDMRADIGASDSIAYLRIRDDGDGLPLDMWERIFEPYQRAHDRYTQPAAVGIGLTISRDLARLMGGDLTYSYDDGWSTFELTLPVA